MDSERVHLQLKGTNKKHMNKKQLVKSLLEFNQTLKNVPTTENGSIDMDKFFQMPAVIGILLVLKSANIDFDYLTKSGFVAAAMLYGGQLNKSTHEILNA